MKIKKIPSEERPREKLIKNSPKTLTNSELLAIILSSGNKNQSVLELSNRLFKKYNLKSLSRLNISKLKKHLGIGDAKACQISACFELGRRLASFKEKRNPKINNAKDIVRLFLPEMSSLEKEHFIGIYLDSRNKIIKQETIFIGSLNESIVHPREIFKIALEENAAGIILLHNHPSGEPSPSEFDIEVAKELNKAGKIIGIEVLDNIIIGGKKYISFRENNLLP